MTLCLKLWISQHICSKWKYRNVVVLMDKNGFVRQQIHSSQGLKLPYTIQGELAPALGALGSQLVWLGDGIFNSFSLSCRNCFIFHYNSTGRHVLALLSSLSSLFTAVFDGAAPGPLSELLNHLQPWVSAEALYSRETVNVCVSLVCCSPGRETEPREKHSSSGREGAWTLEHPTLRSLALLPGLISSGSWAACHWVGNIAALVFQMLYKILNPRVSWCFSFHCRCCFWKWWKRRPIRC